MNDTPLPRAQLAHPRSNAVPETSLPAVSMGFGSLASFEFMQRAATMLSNSSLVPAEYRAYVLAKGTKDEWAKNPQALPNCIVALNMAQRMGADPLMIMQNLHVIEGRPSWSSQFIIASINSCGRFSPLRFEMTEGEEREVEYEVTGWRDGANGKRERYAVKKKSMIKDRSCTAWVVEKGTNEKLRGPTVTMEMAMLEGWLTKSGSKWQTMPEVMLRYRSASFFGRLYSPELLMGLQSSEEILDMRRNENGTFELPDEDDSKMPVTDGGLKSDDGETVDVETGEVTSKGGATAEEKAAAKTARAAAKADKAKATDDKPSETDAHKVDGPKTETQQQTMTAQQDAPTAKMEPKGDQRPTPPDDDGLFGDD